MTQEETVQHSFYIVQNDEGQYFKGFNVALGKSEFVENPFEAKMVMGKPDIKLRPNEFMVEVFVEIGPDNASLSDPFRPRRKPATVVKK